MSEQTTSNSLIDLERDAERIGEALRPLLDELPAIPLDVWHRFSFDVVQNRSGVQVAHIRFAPIAPESAVRSADIAAALSHRGCCGSEHDPSQGKLHGYCVVCGVPWPCETAQHFLRKPVATPPAQREWRCFHCDDVFTDWIQARNHFGYTPEDGAPSCRTSRGEDSELYQLKRRLELYQREDTDLHRKLSAKESERATATREAEEKGYARGLGDAKKHPETLGLQRAVCDARYDVVGWICSICHGWNAASSQQCVHAHSGQVSGGAA